jgi:hypothetical protein
LILSTAEDQAIKLTQDAQRDVERSRKALADEIENLKKEL